MSAPTVFVVDDDPAMRQSMSRLLESVNLSVETFDSARAFLDAYQPDRPGCLVVDVRMPGMSGLELQEKLLEDGVTLPVIIVTGHGDVPMAVNAVKRGALDFIEKPFRAQPLLDRIQEALDRDAELRQRESTRKRVAARLSNLTPREHEVMEMLVRGQSVKQIAADLGLSHKTVQVHRAHIMEKTQAGSLPDLVHLAAAVEA